MQMQDEMPEGGRENEVWRELVCRQCGEVMWVLWYHGDRRENWRRCRRCWRDWEIWPSGRVRPARQLSVPCGILALMAAQIGWERPPASIRAWFGGASIVDDVDV